MKQLKTSIFVLFSIVGALTSIVQGQPSQFSSRGPGGGGALFATSFSPTDPHEAYICCDMSEIFHTTDLGSSWATTDFRQIQSQKLASVQICNNNIRYAVDGANVNGSDLQRTSKSTDAGMTWAALASDPTSGSAYSIFADPNDANHVVVSDYNTLYGSTNAGVSFALKYHTTNNSAGLHIAGAFFDGNNIYVGTNEGVLLSTDGGASFAKANISGIPASEYIVGFAGAKAGSTTRFFCVTLSQVYAGITGADKDGFKNVYKMDWGSGSWQLAKNGIDASALPFFAGMAIGNINIAYVAGGSTNGSPTVYKTTNGGTSWSTVLLTSGNQNVFTGWSGANGDRAWSYGEYSLGFAVAPGDPNYCMISDLGFAHYTSNGGTDWHIAAVAPADENPKGLSTPTGLSYHSVGLENTTCWQINWFDKNNMFGCYSDIKGTRSTDGGATWGFNYSGHNDNSMYYVLKAGTRIYGATSSVHDMYQSTRLADVNIDGGKGKVLVSTDNGASWVTEHDFGHPVIWLATDPSDPNTLYASVIHHTAGGIFVTHNANAGASSTWTQVANPPRTEGHPFNIRVLKDASIVVSYSGRRTSNFTASSGVFYSNDGGASWADRSDNGMKYWTKDVVVDPYDKTENTWYAGVFSGWGGQANNLGGLYKTTNRGQSWSRIKTSDGITSVTFSPSDPNVMYVTSETTGLWYCNNRNNASPIFSQVAAYPFRQPERVFFNPYDTNEVWVSSFGNGMKVGSTGQIISKPDAVKLVSPMNKSTNLPDTVNFVWTKSIRAERYRLQISSDSTFNIIWQDWGVNDTDYVHSYSGGSKLFWRVLAQNSGGNSVPSEIWSFQIISKPASAIVLKSPENNRDTCSLDQILEWYTPARAKTYRVEVSLTSDFTTHIIDSSGLTITFLNLHNLLKATTYFWKVSAIMEIGSDISSPIWKFHTLGSITPPSQVVLISPPNHSKPIQKVDELPPPHLEFEWGVTEGAVKYDFQISKDSLFTLIDLDDSTIIDPTTRFPAEKNIQYWWRVRAKNNVGWGAFSESWTFSDVTYLAVKNEDNLFFSFTNYPNPFSAKTTISYSLDRSALLSLKLFDLLGREISTLASDFTDAGNHSLIFDGSSLANGAYILRFGVNGNIVSRIINIVK